ncbi:MAG TPA: glycosyltransferase family 39 protein, partial [Dehalococcoidia bacterium]|nr:glycosyltransferase family 39 protein [Dehalococcoidia bacterium]
RTMPRAYSLDEQRAGTFNFERDIDTDHWYYGPAYVLLATPGVRWLQVHGLAEFDAWRLANFASFVVGLVFLYLLARRWLEWPAALGSALLTASQPVLWGHAFINPKDIPLMSFFIAAVYLGLRMVDRVSSVESPTSEELRAARQASILKALRAIGLGALAFAVLAWALTPLWNQAIPTIIRFLYQAPAQSLAGRFFSAFASGAAVTPVEVYIDRGLEALPQAQRLAALLAAPFALLGLALVIWPSPARRWLRWLDHGPFGPLPSTPSLRTPLRELPVLSAATLLPGIALGLAISIRVVSPLVGVLVLLYFLLQSNQRRWVVPILYALVASLACLASWPYLWASPMANFVQVFRHMASNPKILSVLFDGQVYASDALPWHYLPTLLARTLTEPVGLLFLLGVVSAMVGAWKRQVDWRSLAALLLWLLVPLLYAVWLRPPMYDGYRHFLFMLPPVFLLAGFGLQAVFHGIRSRGLQLGTLALLVALGAAGIARTHPYEYAYTNTLAGGMGGAFRRFETDYWLTCYKETMEHVNRSAADQPTLFVLRQPANALYYAAPGVHVEPFEPEADATFPGSLLLLTTRTNIDQAVHAQDPIVYQVEKDGAVLCVLRRVR